MIKYRFAFETELKELSELAQRTYVEAFGYSFELEDLNAHLAENLSEDSFLKILTCDKVNVALENERIIGFIQFGVASGYEEIIGDQDWSIKRLYVKGEHQNSGIGSQLIHIALEWMKFHNVKRVLLDVWERNPGAIRFYQRFGFIVIGKIDFYMASGVQSSDDLVMCREL